MKPLNRLKKQKRPFTTEQFYILKSVNDHWLFLDSDTHTVISSSPDLFALKTSILAIFKRYKHYDHYLKVKSKNTFSLPTPTKEYERRVKLHTKEGHVYDYIIEEIITDFYHSKDLENQSLKGFSAPVISQAKESQEVKEVIVPSPKRLLKKKRTRL